MGGGLLAKAAGQAAKQRADMRRAQKLLERMHGIWGRIGRGGKRGTDEVPQGCSRYESGDIFRVPRSASAARHVIFDRLEKAMTRHSGKAVEGGIAFPSRRSARQAASEIAGDMSSSTRAIRASEFRGAPRSWQNSNVVIGRQSLDGRVLWRDDVLGHPRFGMGPHVNVEIDGIGIHLFY